MWILLWVWNFILFIKWNTVSAEPKKPVEEKIAKVLVSEKKEVSAVKGRGVRLEHSDRSYAFVALSFNTSIPRILLMF